MSNLELAANLAYVLAVWLARKNNIYSWWCGIFACALFAILFFQVKLYADVILQCFFIATNFYGWWNWQYGGINHSELSISLINKLTLVKYASFAILITFLHGLLLYKLTDASFPFVDSIILTFSVIAQLLLMQRKLANWLFWIVVNLVAVPLYFVKGLTLTALIYTFLLLNAVWGYKTWSGLLRIPQETCPQQYS